MHFLATLTTLLALGAGIATAAPAVHSSGLAARDEGAEILDEAKLTGIDVYGPIPDDYLDYDKSLGRYHFGPGSNASLWAAAQGFLEESEIEKRQTWANIGIGMWAQDGCVGEGYWYDNVQYNVHHVGSLNMYSYNIKYRGVRSNEQLDFSRKNSGGDLCGIFSFTAPASASQGCRNSVLINCFRLWLR